MASSLQTADFDYELPSELIAQEPLPARAASRMMVVDRSQRTITHHCVSEIGQFLVPHDLLVLNNTRVFPARLRGVRADTGGKAELLLLEPPVRASNSESAPAVQVLPALMKSGFTPRQGIELLLGDAIIRGEITAAGEQGWVEIRLETDADLAAAIDEHGEVPLPPYIHRDDGHGRDAVDLERYQTVYARQSGAVAAPTAGLHFTPELLTGLREQGIETAEVTLHVGPGTFRPVNVERLEDHPMHTEWYQLDETAATAINAARRAGRRVVAVGTTTVRTLETVAARGGPATSAPADRASAAFAPCEGSSGIFIYPPYDFRCVDAMLTNFHLPKSTLIMLVSAFAAPGELRAGRELVLRAYREAIEKRYRFYSYGDCMLVL